MKKQILLIFLLISLIVKTEGQSFETSVDTINISINDLMMPGANVYMTHAIKFGSKYYVYFEEFPVYIYAMGRGRTHFLEISENGNVRTLNNVKNGFYDDLFVWNKQIFLKEYYEKKSYHFNLKEKKWEEIKDLDDFIYEDDRFYVTYLSFGEWGSAIWFRDKTTDIEYELAGLGTIINKVNDIYYLTGYDNIHAIKNPLQLMKCDKEKYYSKIKKEGLKIIKEQREYGIVGVAFANSESIVGTEVVYQDTNYSRWRWDDPVVNIATSFTFDNQLFHLCTDSNYTFIAKIKNGKMIPVQIIGNKMNITKPSNNYRGKNSNGSGLFRKFSTENRGLYGFIEIDSNKIKVRYIKSDLDTLRHLGNDNFDVLFDYVYKNMENMNIREIDSLEKVLNGKNTKIFIDEILHKSYYPNTHKLKFEGGISYIKVLDSVISNYTKYYYTQKDSIVKVIFLEWEKTRNYNQKYFGDKAIIAKRSEAKFDELKQTITMLTGVKPIGENNDKFKKITWVTKNKITINLYGEALERGTIRMVIYKE